MSNFWAFWEKILKIFGHSAQDEEGSSLVNPSWGVGELLLSGTHVGHVQNDTHL